VQGHPHDVVRRDGSMDALTVEVEALAETPESSYPKLASDISHHIKSMIGVTCTVDMKRPGEVPRSQGKAVRVKDLRE